MDSAGPEGLRLRESSSLYFAELFVVVLDGKVHETSTYFRSLILLNENYESACIATTAAMSVRNISL